LLSNSGLNKTFWADTMTYASHLINMLLSSAIGGKTPMEMWSGKAASDYDMLRVFCCLCTFVLFLGSSGSLHLPCQRK